jgi:hypothetical protein
LPLILGLRSSQAEVHAAYVASWLKVLKADKRAVFIAGSYAQNAADFVHSMQPRQIVQGAVSTPFAQPVIRELTDPAGGSNGLLAAFSVSRFLTFSHNERC